MFAIYYTKMNCFFHNSPGLNPWQAYNQPCHVPFPARLQPPERLLIKLCTNRQQTIRYIGNFKEVTK